MEVKMETSTKLFVTVAQAPSNWGQCQAEYQDGMTVRTLLASFKGTPQDELTKVGDRDDVRVNGAPATLDSLVYPNVIVTVIGPIKGN